MSGETAPMSGVQVVDPGTTRELRRSVLRPWLAPGEPLPGDDIAAAVHLAVLVATDAGPEPVSTCFVFANPCPWRPDSGPAWQLRQLATESTQRGRGFGSAVLDAAARQVRARGAVLLWCFARERAVAVYTRAGWHPTGPLFTDAEHPAPHLPMALDLPRNDSLTPPRPEG